MLLREAKRLLSASRAATRSKVSALMMAGTGLTNTKVALDRSAMSTRLGPALDGGPVPAASIIVGSVPYAGGKAAGRL